MQIEKDFEEFIGLLNKHKVKYCLIGAYAFAFYAIPRFTKDMDILVESSLENGNKIIKALHDFGFKSLGLKTEDFSQKKRVVQLGQDPVRIDLLTSITGCTFAEIWKSKKRGFYGRHKVFFIGLNELIKNKKVTRRVQDKIDLAILKKIEKYRQK